MSYAPFKIRICAFLLDFLIIAAYGIFVLGTLFFFFRPNITPLFSHSPVTAELTGFLMMTFPVSLYFILSEYSKWQGTWGKRKMGICVAGDEGCRIGIGRSITRTAIKFMPWEIAHFGIWRYMLPNPFSENTISIILTSVNLIIIIYLILPLTNRKKRNLYDWIAGTVVIH